MTLAIEDSLFGLGWDGAALFENCEGLSSTHRRFFEEVLLGFGKGAGTLSEDIHEGVFTLPRPRPPCMERNLNRQKAS
tara:strand:+ start:254 stop:487 length:234 start_codon:yes stop_codon:yes gene_type:complete